MLLRYSFHDQVFKPSFETPRTPPPLPCPPVDHASPTKEQRLVEGKKREISEKKLKSFVFKIREPIPQECCDRPAEVPICI